MVKHTDERTQDVHPKRANREMLLRRDPETGMVQMVFANEDTAQELCRERSQFGRDSLRVSRYFESAFTKSEQPRFKQDSEVYKCLECRDSHLLSVQTETKLGVYPFYFRCRCADGKHTCSCGCQSIAGVRSLEGLS